MKAILDNGNILMHKVLRMPQCRRRTTYWQSTSVLDAVNIEKSWGIFYFIPWNHCKKKLDSEKELEILI